MQVPFIDIRWQIEIDRLALADIGGAVGGEIDSQLDRGLIAGSYPRSGDSTSSGDTVTIYPSDGSPYVAPKPKSKPKKKGGGNGGGRG